MNKYEGLCCPICHSKLFEDDDIAVCPDCGAPHHRKCFVDAGRCGVADDHGTERQWQPPAHEPEQEQPSEQQSEPEPQYTRQAQQPFGANPFAYADNIDKNDTIDGERTSDIATFVGFNAPRYVEIFRKMSYRKSVAGWNWLAFLIPEYWFFSRKCYKIGTVTVSITLLMRVALLMLISSGGTLYNYLSNPSYDVANLIGSRDMNIVLAIGAFLLIYRVIMALLGDFFYRKKVFSSLKTLHEAGTTDRLSLFRYGGVNLLLPLIIMLVLEIATSLISMFL